MKTVTIEPRFDVWRERARGLLAAGISPDEIVWETGEGGAESLFAQLEPEPAAAGREIRIPRAFVQLASTAACHRGDEQWVLLYRAAWRLTLGGERHLLALKTDPDIRKIEQLAAAVRRDRHKMKAFVRFRKTGENADTGREQFVAWFEPEHRIVELTAPFFAKRFAGMEWSILTPDLCAHWRGDALEFTPGVAKDAAPAADELDEFWRTYYASIFNPARLKLKAMQAEMPKKYWKNLPEAPLIDELTRQAATRVGDMIEAPTSAKSHVSARVPSGVPEPAPAPLAIDPAEVLSQAGGIGLDRLAALADECRACPIHERATQTVFGVGPPEAEIMIVGEQPGDSEDLRGEPFVGPAGQLLDEALETLGLDRDEIYLTNVVKHFKWERRGKRRLHQSPSRGEIHTCRPWLLAETLQVRPKTLVCLGATAAKALIAPDFRLMDERGFVSGCELAERVIATVHPSFLLRLPTERERSAEWLKWLVDLRLAVG